MQEGIDLSDAQLESMANSARRELGFYPWAAWESERSGFGIGFRRATRYPTWLPLFITSDHYVDPLIEVRENEVNSAFGVYLSWNAKKVDVLREAGVDAHHSRHPWHYLNLDKTYVGPTRSGTLVFWPHSSPGYREDTDADEFVSSLMALPDYYRPFTLCLMSYDINLGLHKKLRKFGFPLTTVGDVNSQMYPYRFFRLLRNFWFTAGISVGTQVFYVIWSGRPYRLVGQHADKIKIVNSQGGWEQRDASVWFRKLYPNIELQNSVTEFRSSLELDLKQPLDMQTQFVRDNLGLESSLTRGSLSQIIWSQLAKNSKNIPNLYLRR